MLESPPLNTIGKYIGAYFLEAEGNDIVHRSFLGSIEDKPGSDGNVSFQPIKLFDRPMTPFAVALYQQRDQTVHIQALGRNVWLGKYYSNLQWGPTPIKVGWHEANGKVTLSFQDGGTRFEACRRLPYPALKYYITPSWEPVPHELPTLQLLKMEKYLPYWHKNKGPFPSPEVMRRGTEFLALNFEDIFLLDVDLSKSKLPKAVFTKTTLREVTFSEAHLVEAQFQGCVFTRPGETAICKFNGADLREAKFTDCVADRCRFDWANLRNAKFQGASLVGADFTGADLSQADFTGANLTGAIMKDAVLTGTVFTRSNLTSTNFTGCNLKTAKLVGIVMPQTILTGADFTGNDLSGSDLRTATADTARLPILGRSHTTRTNFSHAKLRFSLIGLNWSFLNLTEASFVNLPTGALNRFTLSRLNAESAILSGMQLNNVNLDGANFQNAVLERINLTAAILDTANLRNAVLKGAHLTHASMMNADLSGADLTNANLSQVELWGDNATVANATMVLTNLTNAYLTGVDFSGIKDKAFQGCTFDGACLANSRFNNTAINAFDGDRLASFVGACLQGANFDGATLFGANMANAAIATEAGTLQATVRSLGATLELSYDPTIIYGEMTNRTTVCPAGTFGPCSIEDFTPAGTPMDAWPAKATPAHLGLAEPGSEELTDQG